MAHPGSHLDGNVLAGPLSEVFREDMTTASGTCAACGDVKVLAQAMVYLDGPGWTVRCSLCDAVMLTLVRIGDRLRIDLRGMATLDAPAAPAAPQP